MFGVYRTGANKEVAREGDGLTLPYLYRVLRRRFWFIALVVVLVTGVALAASLAQSPRYESSVLILVGQDRGFTNSPTEAVGLQQLTQTMNVAADSRTIIDSVIEQENLDTDAEDFSQDLSVTQVGSTQFIEISYTADDPRTASRIANALGEAFSERIDEVSDSANPITATVYEPASVPDEPSSPQPFRDGVIALVLGSVLGVAVAFLLEYIDGTWRSPEEAEAASGVPVLGAVPAYRIASAPYSPNDLVPSAPDGSHRPLTRRRASGDVSDTEDQDTGGLDVAAIERMFFGMGAALVSGGKFIGVGEAFARNIGRRRSELEGSSPSEFGLSGEPSREYTTEDPERGRVRLRERSVPTGTAGETLLTLENLATEQSLRQSLDEAREAEDLAARRLKCFAEGSETLFQSLTPEGRELAANRSWRKFFGSEVEKGEIVFGGSKPLGSFIERCIERGEEVEVPESEVAAENGSSGATVSGRVIPLFSGDSLSEVMVLLETSPPDDGERERLEGELAASEERRAEAEAEAEVQASKFASLRERMNSLFLEASETGQKNKDGGR